MAIIGKAFAGDPLDAALFNPWTSPPPLTPYGTPIGIELGTGRVVYFEPWLLRELRKITGTIFLILAQRDAGKSTLLNMMILRFLLRQAGVIRDESGNITGTEEMSVRITTRKYNMGDAEVEFKPVNDHLFGNFVDLNQAGFVNIFDPRMNMSEWDLLETAVNVCELANNNVPLKNFQPLALQVGVYVMLTQYAGISSPEILEIATRRLTMKDVENYFRNSNSQVLRRFKDKLDENPEYIEQLNLMMKEPHNVPKSEFLRDAAFVSGLLGRVLRADFGQVFGGTNSLYDLLADTVTTLNMTGLNMKARTLIESMLWKWNTVAMANRDFRLIPHLNIADEEHEGANSLMYMRFWAAYVAKARAYSTVDFRAVQFLRQLTEAGSAGSEIRALAKQISMGIGGYFIGQQPPDSEIALQDVASLGLAPQDVHFTTQLRVGEFGLKLPNHPVTFFKAVLTPTELALSQTNQAVEKMQQFVPVMSLPEIQRRAERIGIVQIGKD